jgi:DNA polymerase-3 subunit delta
MSIKIFINELEKGLKHPVYLLYSGEQYLLREALHMIEKTIPAGMRDFTLDAFDAASDEAFSIEGIIDILHTVPFGGGRRTVFIENFQKLREKDTKKMEAYALKPAQESLLVLLNSGKLKKKVALNRIKAIPLSIKESEIPFWIKDKAKEKGMNISDAAADYLIGTVGTDLGLIASEIEKFTLISKSRIEKEDIKGLIWGSFEYDAFDLADALMNKDREGAIRIYRHLSATIEPYSLLGAISWQYEKSAETENKLAGVYALLNEADIKIKTTGGSYPLEETIIKLLRL